MPRTRAIDWTGDQYVKVYRTLPLDRPDVWANDAHLAWWLRLLMAADGAWPGPALSPRSLPTDVEDALVAAGVIDRVGTDSFRFHGLTRLRSSEARAEAWGAAGGRARVADAPRDALGRLVSSNAGEPLVQHAGYTNGEPPASGLDQHAGTEPLVSSDSSPDRQTDRDPVGSRTSTLRGLDVLEPSRTRARPDRTLEPPADCDDQVNHWPSYREVPGLGVLRCPVCDAKRGPSLADKIGWGDDGRPF